MKRSKVGRNVRPTCTITYATGSLPQGAITFCDAADRKTSPLRAVLSVSAFLITSLIHITSLLIFTFRP